MINVNLPQLLDSSCCCFAWVHFRLVWKPWVICSWHVFRSWYSFAIFKFWVLCWFPLTSCDCVGVVLLLFYQFLAFYRKRNVPGTILNLLERCFYRATLLSMDLWPSSGDTWQLVWCVLLIDYFVQSEGCWSFEASWEVGEFLTWALGPLSEINVSGIHYFENKLFKWVTLFEHDKFSSSANSGHLE